LGAALIAVSTAQITSAAQHHHRAAAGEQFRNANNAVASPARPAWYSGGYSAPAGRWPLDHRDTSPGRQPALFLSHPTKGVELGQHVSHL
jgi:hypothetical protein